MHAGVYLHCAACVMCIYEGSTRAFHSLAWAAQAARNTPELDTAKGGAPQHGVR